MQDHRIPTQDPSAVPGRQWESRRLQALVLLELVASPPVEGDIIDDLARALHRTHQDVERAVDALTASGLAVRNADVVRASPAALTFEALWPVRP